MLGIYLNMLESQPDEDKFTLIYEQYRHTMLYVANNILKDQAAAEDAVHDAFVKIIEILDDIDAQNSAATKSLAIIIVRNKAIDQYRRRSRVDSVPIDEIDYSLPSDAPTPLEQFLSEEGYQKLLGYIAELDEKYKMTCLLRYVHHLDNETIAQALDIQPKTVDVRIFRAKQLLKKMIREDYANDQPEA